MKSLEEVLTYQNPQLILRIQRSTGCSRLEARLLFEQTLKWLWLCANHRKRKRRLPLFKKKLPDLRMLEHFRSIDLAWHEFILMTYDYRDFCQSYLGEFIHHTPAPLVKRTLKRARSANSDRYLTHFLEFIYDLLGAETFDLWIHRLPQVKRAS